MMTLDIYGDAIQGARDYQEDCFEICAEAIDGPGDCLAVLCDGMGGHSGGALASQTATKAFIDCFLQLSGMSPADALQASLNAAHKAVQYEVSNNQAPADMGTTLVAVYISGSDVSWLSVGDSHLYHYRKGGLQKLNADHSMASTLDELADIGRISKEEALSDPQRNALRSCLSVDEIALVDIQHRNDLLHSGDKLLLATDGLDTLSVEETATIVEKSRRKAAKVVVGRLLSGVESVAKPNQDNTTVVVIAAKSRSWFA